MSGSVVGNSFFQGFAVPPTTTIDIINAIDAAQVSAAAAQASAAAAAATVTNNASQVLQAVAAAANTVPKSGGSFTGNLNVVGANVQLGTVDVSSWARTVQAFNLADNAQSLAVVSGSAAPAVTTFSRTGDFNVTGGSGGVEVRDSAWGYGSLVVNDNTTTLQAARNAYFEARRNVGAGTTYNVEFNVVNYGARIDISPYVMGYAGSTINYWASAGRTDLPTQHENTCILGAVNNGSKWTKGIVIGNNSIAASITGLGPEAIVLPDHYTITWANPTNAAAKAFITSTATTTSTAGQVGLIFTDTGVSLQTPNYNAAFTVSNSLNTSTVPLVVNNGFTSQGFISGTGDLILTGLKVATDEGSAVAAGVPSHGVYRNGNVLQVRVT